MVFFVGFWQRFLFFQFGSGNGGNDGWQKRWFFWSGGTTVWWWLALLGTVGRLVLLSAMRGKLNE